MPADTETIKNPFSLPYLLDSFKPAKLSIWNSSPYPIVIYLLVFLKFGVEASAAIVDKILSTSSFQNGG